MMDASSLPEEPLRDLYRRLEAQERSLRRMRQELRSLHGHARQATAADRQLALEQTGMSRDLQHLGQRLEGLGKIVSVGNGERPLTTRLAVLENELRDLQQTVREQGRAHWKLLLSMATGLVSLAGTALLWILKGGF